jgi:2-keto-4-pentenoate hydratase
MSLAERSQVIDAAAARIREAETTGRTCEPIRDLIDMADEAAAYGVQNQNTERKLASGRRLVGRKIGLTAKAVQQQLGVDQPDFGMLFDDMDRSQSRVIPFRSVLQPKIEAEVAFILGRSVTQPVQVPADIKGCIESVAPAFEIVGSRIANWNIKFVDTVADNASSGLFVLGEARKRLDQVDLIGCSMRMTKAGETVSSGSGAACMGNPVNALIWLANKMIEVGRPLRAGDVVLSGALGPMVAVSPGDRFTAEIEGLGTVAAEFGLE